MSLSTFYAKIPQPGRKGFIHKYAATKIKYMYTCLKLYSSRCPITPHIIASGRWRPLLPEQEDHLKKTLWRNNTDQANILINQLQDQLLHITRCAPSEAEACCFQFSDEKKGLFTDFKISICLAFQTLKNLISESFVCVCISRFLTIITRILPITIFCWGLAQLC